MKLKRLSIKKVFFALVLSFMGVAVAVLVINFSVQKGSENLIYDADNVPQKEVALVLGARVYEDGRMSDMFQDRVDVAIGLYNSGKVEKILVSGDHGQENYDEVNAAKNYILQQGIPGEDVFLDHAGFDTYDSMYRARDIFQVGSMIVVTQEYHLPRALYIAEKLGVDVVGVRADLHTYGGESYRNFREEFAVVKAWLDIVLKSKPIFLGEPIPISGEGFASWD